MQKKGRINMKLKIIITGAKVHGVGYRVMLVNKALSLGVDNFNVFNTFLIGNQAVVAVIEGDEEILDKLQNKYEEMSREIAQMKITLARIETKVFS